MSALVPCGLRCLALLLACWLAACSTVDFGPPSSRAAPAALLRHFAEFCALSQIKQKPGIGAGVRGEIGGHAVLYLHGACRAGVAGQTTLQLCDEPGAEPADGVGLSMNEHFRNTKWVATPGRDFFFHGGLPPDAPLRRAAFEDVKATAKRLGLYDGVDYHDRVLRRAPPGVAAEDWKYEVAVATDYGIALGRGRFCARVPLNREQLAAMVGFLNDQNAPYRSGARVFEWDIFRDNCIHLAHNALAVAGLWPEWPTDRPYALAVLNFPVPRNEFVNLMRRTGDVGLLDPARLHADAAARDGLLRFGQLPFRAGALMQAVPPHAPNEVFETALKLIFYDDPVTGRYRRWSETIVADPRRSDPVRNRDWVIDVYRRALAERRPLQAWLAMPGMHDAAGFARTYDRLYALLQREAGSAAALPSLTAATAHPAAPP